MESISSAVRRTILLVMLAVGIGAALAWRQSQAATPTPTAAPVWPPLPDQQEPAQSWLPADADGSAPSTHPIKTKESSGIFHVPGGRFYDRTKPDRCYPTAAAAEADGYRRSKS